MFLWSVIGGGGGREQFIVKALVADK